MLIIFWNFFFYVKVQIHAVISCHTKWTPSSLHFVVIYWLPPWWQPFLSLVMMGLQKKLKINRYWCILSMAGWSVWHNGAASVATPQLTLATTFRKGAMNDQSCSWKNTSSAQHSLAEWNVPSKYSRLISIKRNLLPRWHSVGRKHCTQLQLHNLAENLSNINTCAPTRVLMFVPPLIRRSEERAKSSRCLAWPAYAFHCYDCGQFWQTLVAKLDKMNLNGSKLPRK